MRNAGWQRLGLALGALTFVACGDDGGSSAGGGGASGTTAAVTTSSAAATSSTAPAVTATTGATAGGGGDGDGDGGAAGGAGGGGGGGGGGADACARPVPGPTSCDGETVDTATDPANCGRCGHSCLPGGCSAGLCTPFAVAEEAAWGEAVLVGDTAYTHAATEEDGAFIRATSLVDGATARYYAAGDSPFFALRPGEVLLWGGPVAMPPEGGINLVRYSAEKLVVIDTVAYGIEFPSRTVLDEEFAYYAGATAGFQSPGLQLHRSRFDGTDAEVLTDRNASAPWLDGDDLYFIADGRLYVMDKATPDSETQVPGATNVEDYAVLPDGGLVWVENLNGVGTLVVEDVSEVVFPYRQNMRLAQLAAGASHLYLVRSWYEGRSLFIETIETGLDGSCPRTIVGPGEVSGSTSALAYGSGALLAHFSSVTTLGLLKVDDE